MEALRGSANHSQSYNDLPLMAVQVWLLTCGSCGMTRVDCVTRQHPPQDGDRICSREACEASLPYEVTFSMVGANEQVQLAVANHDSDVRIGRQLLAISADRVNNQLQ